MSQGYLLTVTYTNILWLHYFSARTAGKCRSIPGSDKEIESVRCLMHAWRKCDSICTGKHIKIVLMDNITARTVVNCMIYDLGNGSITVGLKMKRHTAKIMFSVLAESCSLRLVTTLEKGAQKHVHVGQPLTWKPTHEK